MSTKSDMYRLLKEQLAREYNCSPADFDRADADPVITASGLHPMGRRYSDKRQLFSMAIVAGNAVITADERLHPFLREWAKDREGHRLFETKNLIPLQRELERYGAFLWGTHHMFLPDPAPLNFRPNFEVQWYEAGDMGPFYGDERFPNAVCQPREENRPDVLAAAAVINGEIAGLAGCSADSDDWWQVGIDVLPEYRGGGIGSTLVGLLKDDILRRGKIPFYGTAAANLRSQKIALNCGFFPAWIEIEAQEGTI